MLKLLEDGAEDNANGDVGVLLPLSPLFDELAVESVVLLYFWVALSPLGTVSTMVVLLSSSVHGTDRLVVCRRRRSMRLTDLMVSSSALDAADGLGGVVVCSRRSQQF